METPEYINSLNQKIDELADSIKMLSEKQNSQYTDIMMQLKGANVDARDEKELYEEAKETVIEFGKASASILQRTLRVGYAQAARLLDKLEEEGIIGPGEGATPRKVFKAE